MYKILLAEDDANLGDLLYEYLEFKGYEVRLCKSGTHALGVFLTNSFDICLLDVMMPEMDGFTLAAEIRKQHSEIPIIFLTAKSMEEDRIKGFQMGADDYVTKPFSMEELVMRIQARLRNLEAIKNPEKNKEVIFEIGEYHFFITTQELRHVPSGDSRKLTGREAQLLQLLCINKNHLLDRQEALETVWKENNQFTSRSMDVYVTKLRKYFILDTKIEIINAHGKGFKLIDR